MDARKTFFFMSLAIALFWTTWSTYTGVYRVAAGLSPLQLVLLGTTLEAAAFFGEIPTGIIADLYSRKWSIIIGFFIIGIGLLLEGLFAWAFTIFLAQAVWGIGYTFTSGATEAWLAGEIGEEQLASTLLRSSQFGRVGSLLGMGLAMAIALASNVRWSLMAGGAGVIAVAVLLPFIMDETGFKPAERNNQSAWAQMGKTFREGWQVVQKSHILLLMFLVTVFIGLGSEGIDRFWTIHLLNNFEFPQLVQSAGATLTTIAGGSFNDFGPNITLWFFIINLSATLIGLLTTEIVQRRLDVDNDPAALRYLLLANGVIIASILVFGLTVSLPAALASWLVLGGFRGTVHPVSSAMLNRHIPQDVRATVLSMWGQADAVGQMISGVLMGAIVTFGPLRWAFVAVAALLAPILWIYRRLLRVAV